ncbi:MAG: tetratricopeptide repeat protein [Chitinophagales bacterium]
MTQIKYIFFFCSFFLLVHQASASVLDSLQSVLQWQLNMEEKENAIATYREVAIEEFVLGDLEASFKSFESALVLAQGIEHLKYRGMSLYSLGFVRSRQNRYQEALDFFTQSMNIGKAQITNEYWYKNLREISAVYLTLGDYEVAYHYKLQILKDYETLQDSSNMTEVLYDIGSIFSYQENYPLALQHYEKALSIAEDLTDTLFIYQSLGAIGSVYGNTKQYDLSLDYNHCSLELAQDMEYANGIAFAIYNTGYDYLNLKQYDKALNSLSKALELMEAQENPIGIAVSLEGIGQVYSTTNQNKKAIEYAEKALKGLEAIGNQSQLRDTYATLANIYFKAGQSTKAFEYQKQYISLKDSLFNQDVLQKMSGLQTRYEIQKKEREQEIAILKKDAKINSLYSYSMIGGSILLVLLLLMLSLFLRSLYKQNKLQTKTNALLAQKNQEIQIQVRKLAQSNQELERFAYIASHDLKEPLRTVGSYISLIKRRYAQNVESVPYFNFVGEGIDRMYRLLDDLLTYSKIDKQESKQETIDLNNLLEIVEQTLSDDIEAKEASIHIHDLPTIKASDTELYQLFENLISNALKFRGEDTPKVDIACSETDKTYIFSVKDNGIGIATEYQNQIFTIFQRLHTRAVYQGNGIGLSICKKIVERYKGKIWVKSIEGVGSTFYFSFPKSEVEVGGELLIGVEK